MTAWCEGGAAEQEVAVQPFGSGRCYGAKDAVFTVGVQRDAGRSLRGNSCVTQVIFCFEAGDGTPASRQHVKVNIAPPRLVQQRRAVWNTCGFIV